MNAHEDIAWRRGRKRKPGCGHALRVRRTRPERKREREDERGDPSHSSTETFSAATSSRSS